MKKNKISNKTIALFAAAMVLLAGGAFSGTQAVLNIFSPEHFLEFETDTQYVQIQENGQAATGLLSTLGGKVVPGKAYEEKISAKNTTKDAPQFVRIIVTKYWKDASGKVHSFGDEVTGEDGKTTTVTTPDPGLIKLTPPENTKWQTNPKESTIEREVYYYTEIVPAGGVTDPLSSTITVDNEVAKKMKTSGPDDKGVITYTYEYDGYQVCLEAEAQSIQTHNAQDAVKSIWGVTNVTATDTTLTVK